MAILIGPNIFKSGLAVRPHRVCHFEVSYAPLAQFLDFLLQKVQKVGSKKKKEILNIKWDLLIYR